MTTRRSFIAGLLSLLMVGTADAFIFKRKRYNNTIIDCSSQRFEDCEFIDCDIFYDEKTEFRRCTFVNHIFFKVKAL